MGKKFKLLSAVMIIVIAASALSACGSGPVQDKIPDGGEQSGSTDQLNGGAQTGDGSAVQSRQTVEFSVEGETVTEEYAVYNSDILSIAYDDKSLAADKPEPGDDEIIKFESSGAPDIDIEVTAAKTGDYKTAAGYSLKAESRDDDIIQISDIEEVSVNGYDCCYFSVSENDSVHEYYFIDYSGSAAGIRYVVFEAEFSMEAADGWVPRSKAMVNTITFK
ncbi:MAG: hypothetical protein Q4C14_01245 [Bacillota bacterium]|nr:hypothetical protein [Bacillota bacterium]